MARDFSNKSSGQSVKDKFSDTTMIKDFVFCGEPFQIPAMDLKHGIKNKAKTRTTMFSVSRIQVSILAPTM